MKVLCPKCGARNHLPDHPDLSKRFRCGSCETPLVYKTQARGAQRKGGVDALRVYIMEGRAPILLFMAAAVGLISTVYHILPFLFSYTDIRPFYYIAVEPGMPYISKMIEYPVLKGLFIHSAVVLGGTFDGYYFITSFLLVTLAIIATYFLYRTVDRRNDKQRILIYWILAPSMVFFLIYNWDIIAVLFVVVALYFIKKDRCCFAALFLALGLCSKLYPVIYLLPLLLRKRGLNEWLKIVGVFGVVAAAINIPFMYLNFEGWYHFMDFNSQRPPNPDSIWGVINALIPQLGITSINTISFSLFAVGSVIVAWKYRHESTIKLCLILTLIFLIFNKVFSPQYLLWLLPFYVLLPMRRMKLFYALELSNLFVLFTILTYLFSNPQEGVFLGASTIFVIIRHILLIYLLFDLLGVRPSILVKYQKFLSTLVGNKESTMQFAQGSNQCWELGYKPR